MKYLIQKSKDALEWLDGYNGGDSWEWSTVRQSSWHLRKPEAERKLKLVHQQFPDAIIIEA